MSCGHRQEPQARNPNHPLAGLKVLVTRPEESAASLRDALLTEAAIPIEMPAIRIVPPSSWDEVDVAIRRGGYDWVVFTSANGVRFFFERLQAAGAGGGWFRDSRVAAIGPATASALVSHGVAVDLVPDAYVAEALIAALRQAGPLLGRRVLLPRADIARDVLEAGLADAGAVVDGVVAYSTVPGTVSRDLRMQMRSGQVDVVTFTSSSTVRAFTSSLGRDVAALETTTIACIGPITEATVREAGLRPEVVATTYTVDGLVDALRGHFAGIGAEGCAR